MVEVLKSIDLEFKTERTDGILTIRRIKDNKVVAAFNPITKNFWIKERNKKGKNGDFVIKPHPVKTFNDVITWGREALTY